jgi:hypothetical protein
MTTTVVNPALTNKAISQSEAFKHLCLEHGVKPTKRQVSKHLNKKGSLYKAMHPSTDVKPPAWIADMKEGGAK